MQQPSVNLPPGSISLSAPGDLGAGDLATFFPTANGDVLAYKRCAARVRSGGFVIRISQEAVLDGTPTLVGSLVVKDVETGMVLSDELAVCDLAQASANPALGTIMFLCNTMQNIAPLGNLVAFVWQGAGDVSTSSRPGIQILDWPLIAVDSFAL